MKKYFIALFALLLGSQGVQAQGLGFYLGGKKVELAEGDSIRFANNSQGEVEVKVTKDGRVEVYRGSEMTFYGDLERYFLDVNNAMHFFQNSHNSFGYGAIMHVRDVVTADLFRESSGYNWFNYWASNTSVGPDALGTAMIWRFYENAITACNKLIGAIGERPHDERQREYLGVAYAYRAMHYLDMARMYEYLDCYETKPFSNTGKRLTNLTVPIITEKTTEAQLAKLTRAPRTEMKAFIQGDLEKAADLLASYKRTSKLLPDLACVYGLQARLNLWVQDYPAAAQFARKAINQSGATPLSEAEMLDVENGFNTAGVSSWMWGTQPRKDSQLVSSGLVNWPSWMSNEATFGYASILPVRITPSLFKEISSDDIRRKLFKTSVDDSEPHLDNGLFSRLPKYASLKFRPYRGAADDSRVGAQSAYPLMRVEEMYFIEAEAKTHASVTEGVNLLVDFMHKYRNPHYGVIDGISEKNAVKEIVKQKRIELWGEGQSYFDYKRLDMPVDRTLQADEDFISHDQQLCCGISMPAWMNFSFPSRSKMQYKWNTIGQENPDPSDRYTPGGGSTADATTYYNVQFADGMARELFQFGFPSEFTTVKACPMDTAEGFVLQEPFKQWADSTMSYDGSPLAIRLNGAEAFIPAQPLGFYIDGEQVMVKSTRNGSYADGVVIFPKNSISVSYGNTNKVVNSRVLTEIRIPGSVSAYCSVHTSFYNDDRYKADVFESNGMKYLHTYLQTFSGLDEARLVCVPTAQAEEAKALLKSQTDYGVTVSDTGWVNIPMLDTEQEFAIVVVGLSHGSVAYSNVQTSFNYRFPNYAADVSSLGASQDEQGNWKVTANYIFGPQAETGYLALVEKYATKEEVKAAFEAGTLPSYVSAKVSHTAYAQQASVPYPERYAEYKLAALSLAGGEVVEVSFEDGAQTYDCPPRSLSAEMKEMERDSNSVSLNIAYEASDFSGAYIALLTDSLLTGNVWKNVLRAPYKKLVQGNGSTYITLVNPNPNESYTVVIAGLDAQGNLVKDVAGKRFSTAQANSRWYHTKAEWVADGNEPSAWPLSATQQTCDYASEWFENLPDRPISYRFLPITGKGQFKIEHLADSVSLLIEYDPSTSACQILPQHIADHANYGKVYIADEPHSPNRGSYETYPCVYNWQTGVFSFYVNYYVSAGTFGTYRETIQVKGIGNSAQSAAAVKEHGLQARKNARVLRFPSDSATKKTHNRR